MSSHSPSQTALEDVIPKQITMMEFPNRLRSPLSNIQFLWDPQFSVRQTISYVAEDNRLQPDPAETTTDSILKFKPDNLDPPCLNFKTLACFLNSANLQDLRDRTRPARLTRLALVDDRRDPCGLEETQPGQPPKSNGQTRSWTSEQYTLYPTPGLNKYRQVLDERGLYEKLREDVGTQISMLRIL